MSAEASALRLDGTSVAAKRFDITREGGRPGVVSGGGKRKKRLARLPAELSSGHADPRLGARCAMFHWLHHESRPDLQRGAWVAAVVATRPV